MALDLLSNNQFCAKASECNFGQFHINFLGHVVTAQGVQIDQDKIQVVQSWPTPTNIKELRRFLSLTRYYRRFVRNYGLIACPPTNLTKKNGFHWNPAAEETFNSLSKL